MEKFENVLNGFAIRLKIKYLFCNSSFVKVQTMTRYCD